MFVFSNATTYLVSTTMDFDVHNKLFNRNFGPRSNI